MGEQGRGIEVGSKGQDGAANAYHKGETKAQEKHKAAKAKRLDVQLSVILELVLFFVVIGVGGFCCSLCLLR